MPESSESTSPLDAGRSRRHLPATGLPAPRDDRRISSVVSIALHVLEIMTSLLESARTGARIELVTTAERPPLVPLTTEREWRML